MYSIKPSTTFAHSMCYSGLNHNRGEYACDMFFLGFTGPVPEDLDSLPFDQSDLFEMYAQAQVGIAMKMDKIETDPVSDVFLANHTRTYLTPKQPYLDLNYNKWSFYPKVMLREEAWKDWKAGTLDNLRAENYASSSPSAQRIAFNHSSMIHTEFRYNYIMLGMRFYWNTNRYRDRNLADQEFDSTATSGNYYSYYSKYCNSRSAQNYPLILEFDEAVEVDALEYYRGDFSDNRYSSNSLDIEAWDETLNDGNGGWSVSQQVLLNEDGTASEIQYAELETIVTSKVFRITFSDTGGYNKHFGYLRLLSSTPPETLPVNTDITWGLVLPYHDRAFYFQDFLYRDYYVSDDIREGWFTDQNLVENPEVHKLPIPLLLVDVDGPNKNATVTLTKARNIEPGQVPELANFILDLTNA